MSQQRKIEGLNRPELTSTDVLAALDRVPREAFVPNRIRARAFEDRALPIGMGQTISQPFIVGLMSQEAHIGPGSKVLEIGTGSGYQAAVLAELGAEVYSIEIVRQLGERAAKVLGECGYGSINLRIGDGWDGWPGHAPFDAILVTASSPRVPDKLLNQLRIGGRLIVPIEYDGDEHEVLMLYQRTNTGFEECSLGSVRFVDLTGKVRQPGTEEIANFETDFSGPKRSEETEE